MTETSESEQSLHQVAPVAEIESGTSTVVEVDGEQIALFNVDGEFHALSNVCPHQGGPLGQGRIEDDCVYCPWHGWQFDVETGEHVQGEDTVGTYDLVVEDDDIYVRL